MSDFEIVEVRPRPTLAATLRRTPLVSWVLLVVVVGMCLVGTGTPFASRCGAGASVSATLCG